jgi:methylated-DNA-protein-cysteine methyltransferase related protein
MSYGAIADYLSEDFGRGSPRRVGTIMAQYGGSVPWYRVVASNGRLPPGHEERARRLLESEGVVFHTRGVTMATYAWQPPDRACPATKPLATGKRARNTLTGNT